VRAFISLPIFDLQQELGRNWIKAHLTAKKTTEAKQSPPDSMKFAHWHILQVTQGQPNQLKHRETNN